MEIWDTTYWIALAAGLVVALVQYFWARRPPDIDERLTIGGNSHAWVTVIEDKKGRNMVGLTFAPAPDIADRDRGPITACLTVSQARRIAELLHIAAAPGRTVAQARRAAMRTQRPSSAGPVA